jgi:hypothetical protein
MAVNLKDLSKGILSYAIKEPALDDVRFDRIRTGFAGHYLVDENSSSRFRFERGEGYPRVGRFDAFALIDSGSIMRVKDGGADPAFEGDNVIAFAPRYGWIMLSLNIRSTLILWALLLLFLWFAFGGDWLAWLVALIAGWTGAIIAVQRSVRAKMREWLAPRRWN